MRPHLLLLPLVLATGFVLAEETPEAGRDPNVTETKAQTQEDEEQPKGETNANLGMSILGNQEAPKSLVIVPWKSSELGLSIGITPMLDDSRNPVDKEVFMRALSYYEIRSGLK